MRHSIHTLSAMLLLFLAGPAASGGTLPDARDQAVVDSLETLLLLAPHDLDVLRRYWHFCTDKGEYGRVVRSTVAAWADACRRGDDSTALYSAVMAGQAYAVLGRSDSMTYYLDRAERLAGACRHAWALGTVCNTRGMYAVDHEMNFQKAITHFIRGMEITEGVAPTCYYAIEGNLAITYYLRNDPEGLHYARDVLRYGEKIGHPFYTFIGSSTTAYLLHLSGQDEEALQTVEQAVALVDRFYDHAGVYTLYADILAALGERSRAETYYRKAFDHLDNADAKSTADTYLNYGNHLIRQGRYAAAAGVLREGISRNPHARENCLFRYRLYLSLSEACRLQGDVQAALAYYRMYHRESDSIFHLEREHSLNELLVRYETEKHRREVQQKEVELLYAHRRMAVAGAFTLVVLGFLAMTGILYRRKNRMYHLIARKYHDMLQQERHAGRGATDTLRPTDDALQEAEHDGAGERLHELFLRTERLLREERVYCDKTLSIERLAARLRTNRTYLSSALNRYARASFKSYVNSLRIEEAVRVLSCTADDTPLKVLADRLGFNTLSTFYRSFQSVVGMPPSRFRQEMRRLERLRP